MHKPTEIAKSSRTCRKYKETYFKKQTKNNWKVLVRIDITWAIAKKHMWARYTYGVQLKEKKSNRFGRYAVFVLILLYNNKQRPLEMSDWLRKWMKWIWVMARYYGWKVWLLLIRGATSSTKLYNIYIYVVLDCLLSWRTKGIISPYLLMAVCLYPFEYSHHSWLGAPWHWYNITLSLSTTVSINTQQHRLFP